MTFRSSIYSTGISQDTLNASHLAQSFLAVYGHTQNLETEAVVVEVQGVPILAPVQRGECEERGKAPSFFSLFSTKHTAALYFSSYVWNCLTQVILVLLPVYELKGDLSFKWPAKLAIIFTPHKVDKY